MVIAKRTVLNLQFGLAELAELIIILTYSFETAFVQLAFRAHPRVVKLLSRVRLNNMPACV